MIDRRTRYLVDVPPGTLGDCAVDRFTVSQADAELSSLRAAIAFGQGGRAVPAGTYTRLCVNGCLLMTDTPAEISDHFDPFHHGRGPCLVNGLGLGVTVNGLLMKPDVTHVTVVEINQDVIRLVGEHWKARYDDRLDIIQADALTYRPPKGTRYGYVWHDIWPAICADNLDDMKHLHRRYGRRSDRQGSWCRAACQYQADRSGW